MLKLKKIFLFALFCCMSFPLFAQKTTVRATIEPSDILIGEQAIINVEAIVPKGRNVIFQMYPDTLVKGVEVLEMFKPDTVLTEVMTISQKYAVTSFDSTLYNIPHMMVIEGNDTLLTNNLGLKVSAPQLSDSTLAYLEKLKNKETDSIDFVRLELNDIKDIQTVPWKFEDLLDYLYIPLIILLVLALMGAAVYFYMRKKKKGYYFKPKIELPPHVVAIQSLDKLKASKKWQQGQEKEYFTELTDILRQYVDRRFNIDAPEMISDDIIAAVHLVTDTRSATDGLAQVLKLADLVKFAKYTPFADESDLSLVNAYLFVNQTKIEERLPAEGEKEAVDKESSAKVSPTKESDNKAKDK